MISPLVPFPVLDAAAGALGALPAWRRDRFLMRVERWWEDLDAGLREVYHDEVAAELAVRVVRDAAAAHAARPPELLHRDEVRLLRPDWFELPDMLGYAAYADRFAGTLRGVADRVAYLEELGVTYLHLMPLLATREGDSDGGYAVADYRQVRPDLGTTDDLRKLASELHGAGISLVLDLVLNHVAREHPWAAAARAGDPRYRAYFHVFADRAVPDAYERSLPEVFPDFAPGNFTWDAEVGGWVWTTFNSFQWDLDWANPDVFAEFVDTIMWLANLGVDVLRLDAIAFLWKRMGTDCQNQPEVHQIVKALRALVRMAAPAVIFKAEAIVGPSELVQYLGRGPETGKLCDLAYHNSLMVQVWSMLAAGDARLAAHALGRLPAKSPTAAWVTYARCHDDIGWAIDDGDAAAAGFDGYLHRAFLSDWYAGEFPGSPARGLVFQANPATGDRRISGMAASLAGLESAGEDPVAADLAVARLLLAHALVMGWGGIPVLWMGDELGMLNDRAWAAEAGHEGDNRWVHRPRMDWELAARRHDPATVAGRMWSGLRHLVDTRRRLPHLHAAVEGEVLPLDDHRILPVLRRHPVGPMLGLYNVSADRLAWPATTLRELGLGDGVDALTGEPASLHPGADVGLGPYQARWVVPPGA